MTRQEFIDTIWDAAVRIRASGAPISVPIVVAQAILESRYGESRLASEHHNLFGIKGDYNGKFVEYVTTEQRPDGTPYTVVARFRSYNCWDACIGDYARIIERLPWYQDAEEAANNPSQFLYGLLVAYNEDGSVKEPGWATDINYYNKVWAIVLDNRFLDRMESSEDEEFQVIEIYDGNRKLSVTPLKHNVAATVDGKMRFMARVKPTTFWQRLVYLFS